MVMTIPRGRGIVRNIRARAIAMALVVMLLASGHHSESGFDTESVVAFQGTVAQFSWRNPHAYITIETMSDSGERVEWEIETDATPILVRGGWTPESLTPGDAVSVRGHPARDGRHYALLISLENARDGSVFEQTEEDSRATGSTSDLSGVWKGNPSELDANFERLANTPLTEKGAAAQEQFDVNSEDPGAMCIADTSPTIVALTALFLSEIEINEDVVVIRTERFDVERTVFMDGRGHPDDDERTIQGHSIGWWEDDTLVVDTTHFADHRSPGVSGVPSGAQKHVVERYTLSDDGTRIIIDTFLEDPEYLAEPLNATYEWNYRPDLELLRYECDPSTATRHISR